MAINSYDSPASFAPRVDSMGGALGGMWAQEQQANYRDAVQRSNELKALAMQQEQNKMTDYGLDQPVREAERLAKIAGFQSDVTNKPQIQAGLASLGRSQVAGEKDRDRLAASEAQGKISDEQLKQWQRPVELMSTLGPSLIDESVPMLQRLTMYDNFRQQHPEMHLPEKYDVGTIAGHVKTATAVKKIMQDRDLAKQQGMDAAHMERTRAEIKGRADVEAMKERAKATAVAQAQAKVESTEKEINRLELKAAKGPLSEQEKALLERLYVNWNTAQAMKAIGQGMAPQIMNRLPTTPGALGQAAGSMVQGAREAVGAPAGPKQLGNGWTVQEVK